MALTPTQEAIKKAIENQNAAYRSGDKEAMAKAATATANAEKANAAAYASKNTSNTNTSSNKSGGSKSTSTPTLASAVDPAKQKADQDYINSTYKGGLASYAKNQQDRYNTADPTLRAALEADAKRVGFSLSGSSTAKTQQIDNRSAREKYGTPTDPIQLKALEDYEKELKEKGYAKLPDYLQDASGKYQDDLMAANRNRFYQENSKNWNDAQKSYYAAQEAQIAKNGGSVSKAIMNNDYFGTERMTPTGQSGKFDWQTGKFSGDARMLDPNFDPAKDSQYRDSIRDQRFAESYQELVNAGKLEDNQETRDWYNSYKADWDKKNPTSEQTINPTLAALISQQREEKNVKAEAQATPAGAAPAIQQTQTQQPAATPSADNQKQYLEGLVAKGGGVGEWAKTELAKLNEGTQQAPSTTVAPAAAPTPTTTPASNITPQQAAGTDWAAKWNTAVANGDVDAMEEAVQARGVKLSGMSGVTDKMLADQKVMEDRTKAARAEFNAANPNSEDALTMDLIKERAKSDAESMEIIKKMESFEPIDIQKAIDDAGNWAEAMEQARAQLDPKYDQARLDRLAAIDKDAVRRGFYGQMPTSKRKLTDAGLLENDRAAAVATLAQSILGMSKDDAYKKATFQASERQATLSNLLAQLQARQGLSQQNTSILSALLQSAQNKAASKQNQANADRAYELEKTQMDFNVENMKKQWGYNDAEAARAEKEFNFKVQAYEQDLQKGRIQIANSLKSGSGSGSSSGSSKDAAAAAKVTEALRKEQIANAEQARKIADSVIGSGTQGTERQTAWTSAYNKALNDLNQRTEDFYKGLL